MVLFGLWYWEWADSLVYPVLPLPVVAPGCRTEAAPPVMVNFSMSRGGGGSVLQAGDGARYYAQNSLDALDTPGA